MKNAFNLIFSIMVITTGLMPLMVMSLFVFMRSIKASYFIYTLPKQLQYYIVISVIIVSLYFVYHGIRYLVSIFKN